jgi:hypothetical protein
MIVFERALICAAVVLSGSAATAQKVRFENKSPPLPLRGATRDVC